MDTVMVMAPCAGWATSLDAVPDPVFAQRMMGDGIALSPLEGVVRAPCDATIVAVAPTRHSITLQLANGAHLLIHVGLDSVALGGRGFDAPVHPVGSRVRAGDVLLRFDLDAVASGARSLVTPMVVVNDGFRIVQPAVGRLVDPARRLFAVERVAPTAAAAMVAPSLRQTGQITTPGGLHARPAARLASAVKPFDAEVTLHRGERSARARSVVDLLALGLAEGDAVEIRAGGTDADAALAAAADLLFPDHGTTEAGVPTSRSEPILEGHCAVPGVAAGPIHRLRDEDGEVPADATAGAAAEQAQLAAARRRVRAALAATGGDIAEAHMMLLEDPEVDAVAAERLAAGRSAARAWRDATRACAERLAASGNARNAERAADLRDLERRVLAELGCGPREATVPPGSIVVADEVLPSFLLGPQAAGLAGIVTARGGRTSHAALLAAAAGLPMLVGVGEAILSVADGAWAVLDATAGRVDTQPSPDALAAARGGGAAGPRVELRTPGACTTRDGVRIEILANLASPEDAARAAEADAEGCGLLRTELLFARHRTPPTLAEQIDCYARIADALGDRPIVVRTLDVGADKPLAYLPLPPEENPALGFRGIRVALAYPDLLRDQLRAVLTAIPAARCRIMVPMVVDPAELVAVRAILDEVRAELGTAPVALGAMIETPAAALLADDFAAEADFLSIGTNDLTQYVLAADRGNDRVAALVDPLHPAALRLIAAAGAAAQARGRPAAVCGALAARPEAVPLLLGLGVTELSVPVAAVAATDAGVRRLHLDDCRALAVRALAAKSAAGVLRILEGEINATTA